jgi:Uri superfamily endonuclease
MTPSAEAKSLSKLKIGILRFFEAATLKEAKGVYTLVILVSSSLLLKIGRLGERRLERGYYAYTGSALGRGSSDLASRVSRHLSEAKKKRWHIDYLLSSRDVKVKAVVLMVTDRRMECEINQHLMRNLEAEAPISDFGSSDCRMKCRSHLLYLGLKENPMGRVAETYHQKGGRILVLLSDET